MAKDKGKPKDPAAVALAKKRAEKLTAARRKAIAKQAAAERWKDKDQSNA